MSMDPNSAAKRAADHLAAKGFNINHENTKTILECICKGIIEEIQAKAEVPVTSGSSAGSYKVL